MQEKSYLGTKTCLLGVISVEGEPITRDSVSSYKSGIVTNSVKNGYMSVPEEKCTYAKFLCDISYSQLWRF